jgi:hypothetical protein
MGDQLIFMDGLFWMIFFFGRHQRRNNSWKNKYGYQLGVKYYNAFKVDNLQLQLEYNHVRPYVYSHSMPITNYAQ